MSSDANGARDAVIMGGLDEVNDWRFEFYVALKGKREASDTVTTATTVFSFRLALRSLSLDSTLEKNKIRALL